MDFWSGYPINQDFVQTAIKALLIPARQAPKLKGNNLLLFNKFNDFYNTKYSKLGYVKVSGTNMTQIIRYETKGIVTLGHRK